MSEPPSIVLLHGVQSSSSTWWRIEEDLVDLGWTVSAYDLLGHGDRRHTGTDVLTLHDLAADVADRMPAPVDLIAGHSLGALVALVLLGEHPELARGVLLEDPPGLSDGLDPATVADAIDRSVADARTDPDEVRRVLLRDNPYWAGRDADVAVDSRQRLDAGAIGAMLRSTRWDLPQLVGDCAVPVELLVADSEHGAVSESDRAALRRLLPETRYALISSGHSIHRDRPSIWLQRALAFARELGRARPGAEETGGARQLRTTDPDFITSTGGSENEADATTSVE